MYNSTFNLPVFVWVLMIGVVVCYVIGYCQYEGKVLKNGKVVYCCNYSDDLMLLASAGFGLSTVITCLKYSIGRPNLFILKVGLFILTIVAIALMCAVFWYIAYSASMSSRNRTEEEGRRHHRHTR